MIWNAFSFLGKMATVVRGWARLLLNYERGDGRQRVLMIDSHDLQIVKDRVMHPHCFLKNWILCFQKLAS